jgi:stage II sporulation protein AA (anti-sigma F factor antagonist)
VLDHYPTEPDRETELLSTRTTRTDTTAVVTVVGELDLASAPQLLRTLLALFSHPVRIVILDCAGLEFLDSSGLNVLNRARDTAVEHGIELVLRELADQPRRVLEVTHMTELFTIE